MNTASFNPDYKRDVLALLAQNLGFRGSVLPLPARYLTSWAKGLGLPRGGEVVLYTGHIYQLVPVIRLMEEQAKRITPEKRARLSRMARWVNPLLNVSAFSRFLVPSAAKARYERCLRNVVHLLRRAGVEPGYLYEGEKYAGALAFDLGLDGPFERHARRVARRLKSKGVKEIITVDPHTTDILRNVYPKVVQNFDIRVRSYLEVLVEAGLEARYPWEEEFVFHDSCVYARYLGLIDEPRKLLEAAGVSVLEPDQARALTHCCGGPVESLFPETAERIARARMEQLAPLGRRIVTACPICWLNLERVKDPRAEVFDISEVLATAFGAF